MIEPSAKVYTQLINKTKANWGQAHIVHSEVDDDTDYLRFAPSELHDFYNIHFMPLGQSVEDFYPTFYKIAGYSVFRDLNRVHMKRTTYDFLNFLGDVGGLDGFLVIVFYYLTAYAQEWNLSSYFSAEMFKKRTKPRPEATLDLEERVIEQRLKSSFEAQRPIETHFFGRMLLLVLCCRFRTFRNESEIHRLTVPRIEKDFDMHEITKKLRSLIFFQKAMGSKASLKMFKLLQTRFVDQSDLSSDSSSSAVEMDGKQIAKSLLSERQMQQRLAVRLCEKYLHVV